MKVIVFLYTRNGQLELKQKTKTESTSFSIALERKGDILWYSICLATYILDLFQYICMEKNKTLMKVIKIRCKYTESYSIFMDWKTQYCQDLILTYLINRGKSCKLICVHQ